MRAASFHARQRRATTRTPNDLATYAGFAVLALVGRDRARAASSAVPATPTASAVFVPW